MIRALGVECQRLWRRRAARLLAALALIGCLVVLGFAIDNASPPSAADRAAAQAQVDRQLADPMFQQQLADCQEAVAAGGSDQWPADMDCEQAMTPKLEWYLGWSPPNFVQDFTFDLLAVTMILSLAMVVVGVTFAGADWAAGTMGTQLLYQPRRLRVFASKAGAVVAAAVGIGAVGAALAWAVSYWAAARWGTTAMVEHMGHSGAPTAVTAADLIGRAGRAVGLVAGAALGGYLLAMLFRSSLVAIALIAAYGLVAETVFRGLFRSGEQYLLSSRIAAWLQGPYEIVKYPPQCGMNGLPCEPEIISISVTAGGVYLAVLLAVVLAVAGVLFARRDVN